MNVLTVRSQIRSCSACSLRETATEPVPWRGATPASYAVLGMAPGKTEDLEGKPFIGPAGWRLEDHLKKANFPLKDVAYLNPVCCYPGRDDKGGDNEPSRNQLEACRPNLIAQLDIIQPRYLIICGAVALRSLRPDLDLKMHGRPLYYDGIDFGKPVFWNQGRIQCWVTYHPAAALRSLKYEMLLSQDLKDFWEWRRTGEPYPTTCWKCLKSVEKLDAWGVATCPLHSFQQPSLPL